jgi:hypothetical protein
MKMKINEKRGGHRRLWHQLRGGIAPRHVRTRQWR